MGYKTQDIGNFCSTMKNNKNKKQKTKHPYGVVEYYTDTQMNFSRKAF